jgi:hypothetical protein
MQTDQLKFSIVESGCIIWVGAGDLGGIPADEFDLWDSATAEKGLAMTMGLCRQMRARRAESPGGGGMDRTGALAD